MQESTKFEMLFHGEGWTETLSEPEEEYANPPNKKIIVKVSGANPGYGITCLNHCLAAITVLTEKEKLPNRYVFDLLSKNKANKTHKHLVN